MTVFEALATVVDALEANEIPYMLTGSIALMHYGLDRSTKDVDLVVQHDGDMLRKLSQALPGSFRVKPQLSFETITGTTKTEIHVQGTPYIVELFRLSDHPHDQARFQNRRRGRYIDRDIWIPRLEDALLAKLRWMRPQHAEDLKVMLGIQWHQIDWSYLQDWAARLEVSGTLSELRLNVADLMREPPP